MIRRLHIDDAAAYANLRREMLVESPLAFASSPGDDMFSSVERARQKLKPTPESVIFGAFDPGLIGAVGLYRDRHVKSSHKAHLWGMYVNPDRRRQGIAADLLTATLQHARELAGVSCVQLSVSSAAPAARGLYERFGFHLGGTEPDALRHEGQTVVEYHMALRLGDTGPGRERRTEDGK
jgi:RimJ/RimL family protein N-acetyltransferase